MICNKSEICSDAFRNVTLLSINSYFMEALITVQHTPHLFSKNFPRMQLKRDNNNRFLLKMLTDVFNQE